MDIKPDDHDNEKIVEIELDSEDMNPELVLFGEGISVKIPVPEAKIFNNLDEYYKKAFPNKNVADTKFDKFDGIRKFKLFQDDAIINAKQKHAKVTDVLQKMNIDNGPLNLLYLSINSKIKILTRRRKSCQLREERFSWLTGNLVAFDKHFNLALKDVLETYQHQMPNSNESKTIKKFSCQMLIRGDNIILISKENVK